MQRTVMVVEDDAVYRELVVRHLGDAYALVFADSLRGASELFRSHIPDCILLDLRLPDGDGIEFLPKTVKADVPVILCTAHGSEALAVQAMKAGADDYLAKEGLGKLELRRAIRGAIQRAQLRAEVKQQMAEKDLVIRQLRAALNDNEVLRGIIPICASCKKIRDDEGYWHMVEAYVSRHTGARFTHGLCPECLDSELEKIETDGEAVPDDENWERR